MSEIDARARWLHEAVAPYAASHTGSVGVTKLSVSLPSDLVDIVRAAAAASGTSVSATIAAALRRTLVATEQERLDAALALDGQEDREWAAATANGHARLLAELAW